MTTTTAVTTAATCRWMVACALRTPHSACLQIEDGHEKGQARQRRHSRHVEAEHETEQHHHHRRVPWIATEIHMRMCTLAHG